MTEVIVSSYSPLPRLEAGFITATLIIMTGDHAGRRTASQLLVVELQRHALIMLLSVLFKQLLLDSSARRLRTQLCHLHWRFTVSNSCACNVLLIASAITSHRVWIGGGEDLMIVLEAISRTSLLGELERLLATITGLCWVGHLLWDVGRLRDAAFLRPLLLRDLLGVQLGVNLRI